MSAVDEAPPGITLDATRGSAPSVDQGPNSSGSNGRVAKEGGGATLLGSGGRQGAFPYKSGKPAHAWHSNRRAKLMEDSKVRAMLQGGADNHRDDVYFSMAVTVGVVCTHFTAALAVQEFSASHSLSATGLAVFAASATVGAQCAFVLQALNHELAHALHGVRGHWAYLEGLKWTTRGIASAGSALCHIPWTAYYFGIGHRRHHLLAGSQRDVDAEALFWLWEPPGKGILRRTAWLSAAALCVPIAYGYSLIRYAMYDWRRNVRELFLVAFDGVLTFFAYRFAGRTGAAYLLFSSSFSMGMLCHPLVGFWILQHICVNGLQPTVSYQGSKLWNTLCLNELLHVEHHDLAGLSWRNLPKLRELKPDLYENLYTQRSIFGLIWTWLTSDAGPNDLTHDFGCRKKWGFAPQPQPPQQAPQPAQPQTRLKQA